MELQAFEVQVCAKADDIFGKSPIGRRFCYFSIVLGRTKWDSNRFFDNLIVKHMDALRKQVPALADYVLNNCFWT